MWLGQKKKKFLSHIHNLDNIHMLCDLIVKIQNCFRGPEEQQKSRDK